MKRRNDLAFGVLAFLALASLPVSAQRFRGLDLMGGFVENQGQFDGPWKYLGKAGPWRAGTSTRGWSLFFSRFLPAKKRTKKPRLTPPRRRSLLPEGTLQGLVLRFTFLGAQPDPLQEPEGILPGRRNFFLGNVPSRWKTDLRAWRNVFYHQMYPRVDIRLRLDIRGGYPEYDILLQPGADLDRVVVKVEGIQGLEIDSQGVLVLKTEVGKVLQPPPSTWTLNKTGNPCLVPCSYRILGKNTFGFLAPRWDPRLPLRIDPKLNFATYLGGSKYDYTCGQNGKNGKVTKDGSILISGDTASLDFPTSPGAFQTKYQGDKNNTNLFFRTDCILACLSPSGSKLNWGTYFGGKTSGEVAIGHELNKKGEIILVGSTGSWDFPTTKGVIMEKDPNLYWSGYVASFAPKGNRLVFSTYLDGSRHGQASTMTLAPNGDIVLGGNTESRDYPVTKGAFLTRYPPGGICKAYVARLASDGTKLRWATYLAGSGSSGTGPIAVSSDDKVFICCDDTVPFGWGDFPTTPDALSRVSRSWNLAGYAGSFLRGTFSVLSPDGSKLLYSTYLTQKSKAGEWAAATPTAMGLVDPKGKEVYFLSYAYGKVPTTEDAFDRTPSYYPCRAKNFFMTVDWAHRFKILYSTFLPPFLEDMKNCHTKMGYYSDANLLPDGKLVTVGTAISYDCTTTPQAYLRKTRTPLVPFLSFFDLKEKKVLYSSYFSDYGVFWHNFIVGIQKGSLVFSGVVGGNFVPVTPNAFQKVYNKGVPKQGRNIPFDLYLASMPLEAPGVTRKGKSTWYQGQVPTLYVRADPYAGKKAFGFECWNAPPSSSGVLLVTRKTRATPLTVFGAQVYLDFSTGLWPFGINSGKDGKAIFPIPLPISAKGISFAAQALFLNPSPYGLKHPLSATAALEVTVQ